MGRHFYFHLFICNNQEAEDDTQIFSGKLGVPLPFLKTKKQKQKSNLNQAEVVAVAIFGVLLSWSQVAFKQWRC